MLTRVRYFHPTPKYDAEIEADDEKVVANAERRINTLASKVSSMADSVFYMYFNPHNERVRILTLNKQDDDTYKVAHWSYVLPDPTQVVKAGLGLDISKNRDKKLERNPELARQDIVEIVADSNLQQLVEIVKPHIQPLF